MITISNFKLKLNHLEGSGIALKFNKVLLPIKKDNLKGLWIIYKVEIVSII